MWNALRKWCDGKPGVVGLRRDPGRLRPIGKVLGLRTLWSKSRPSSPSAKVSASSLPLSGVVGRSDVLDAFDHGALVSTHSGNPICAAAALANLKKIVESNLPAMLRRWNVPWRRHCTKSSPSIRRMYSACPLRDSSVDYPIHQTGHKGTRFQLAHRATELCFQKGLLLFAPVGAWGQTIKICPPLTITEEALRKA